MKKKILDTDKIVAKQEKAYEKTIEKLEKEVRRLKSENKTLQDALAQTDEYLIAISKDKTVDKVMHEVEETKLTKKVGDKCPNCGSSSMKKINLGFVKIITCNCGYRNRINE